MTAEEFLEKQKYWDIDRLAKWEVKKAMIEFTKYHVEQALKEASEKIVFDYSEISTIQQLILNAYPLTNIK